ncbi:glycosyltransferase [Streptomyces sp. NPDC051561]|uniref:glycosyltransferase n=1 Tax=Streptomyces sp. NPDC051561 TaxID=3365658 RepID=UPI0037A2F365
MHGTNPPQDTPQETPQEAPQDTLRDIFLVSNSVDEVGGVTSWTHQMARLFAARGHRVQVVGIVPAPAGRRHDLGPDVPYATTTLYAAHPPQAPRVRRLHPLDKRKLAVHEADRAAQAAKLTALFKAAGPGAVIIVTQVWAMEWVALADTSGLTTIGMSHESFAATKGSSRFRRVQKHYRNVDRLLALTREDADLWIAQGKLDNVGFMPNPLPFFPEQPSARTDKNVVSIGRLSHEKGIDMLLSIWAEVSPRHPDWTLRVYGTGDREAALHQQAEDLEISSTVQWLGRTSDVPGALREGSVFVLTSRAEGFPLAPMEAMATAVPCVAFDMAPGMREIVNHEVDGLLARPGNVDEFAAMLSRLIEEQDLRDKMGDTARENIQRFSAEKVTDRWEELFGLLAR